jgi:hypothetical protein
VHREFAKSCTKCLQRPDEVAVEFHHGKTASLPQQWQRDCTLAGAYFDQLIAVCRMYCCNDPADDGRIVQKVLAEPFPGTVTQGVILVLVIINSQL